MDCASDSLLPRVRGKVSASIFQRVAARLWKFSGRPTAAVASELGIRLTIVYLIQGQMITSLARTIFRLLDAIIHPSFFVCSPEFS